MEASDCVYGGYYRPEAPQFAQENKQSGDNFIVEDLLDFSNEEEDNGTIGGDDWGFETATLNSTDSSTVTAVDSCNSSFSGGDHQFSSELCEPYDELAELEWLSSVMEESFSSEDLKKLQLISGVIKPGWCSVSGTKRSSSSLETRPVEDLNPAQLFLSEASPFPAKARSKRSRAAHNSWSSRLLVLPPSDSDSDSPLLNPNPVRKTPEPVKKRERGVLVSDGRRCLHCATDKTPQWRMGPMGPKTLCNACGVRYKSGRLVPEYRPASSPTLVPSKHSNSHRKVMELQRQTEMRMGFGYRGGKFGDGDDDGILIHHHSDPQIS